MGQFLMVTVIFQSTPPRRRRRARHGLKFLKKFFFNPRLREGGDVYHNTLLNWLSFFNPRLREGGDLSITNQSILINIFNPRLREGGDTLLFGKLPA